MTKEKLDIGRRVYEHELTVKEASEAHGTSQQTIYLYVREYLALVNLK